MQFASEKKVGKNKTGKKDRVVGVMARGPFGGYWGRRHKTQSLTGIRKNKKTKWQGRQRSLIGRESVELPRGGREFEHHTLEWQMDKTQGQGGPSAVL